MPDWLQKPLRRVRRFLVLQAVAEGILLLFFPVGLALAHLTMGGGEWFVLLAWFVFFLLLVRAAFKIVRSREGNEEIARRLEHRFPNLDTSVLNAVWFEPRLAIASAAGTGEALPNRLAAWEMERARTLLEGVEPRRAVSWDRLGRILMAFGALLILDVGVYYAKPGEFLAAIEKLLDPGARLTALIEHFRTQSEARAQRDILADLTVEVKYPTYTGLPPKRVVGGDGTVSALKGSVVSVSARSLESIDEVALEIFAGAAGVSEGAPSLSLQGNVEGGRVINAGFTVSESGSYRFLLDGDPTRYYPIQMTEDAYPSVNMPEPSVEREVTPKDVVDVLYNASDDFGVTKMELVAEVAGREERKMLFEPQDLSLAHQGRLALDLSMLGIEEGDESITLYVEATDNDTVSGPKVGRSGSIVLTLRSAERLHASLLADQERLLDGLIRWLADALEPFPLPAGAKKEELVQGFAALDEWGELTSKAFDEILAKMREDELADYNVFVALQNMGREVKGLHANLNAWATSQALTRKDFGGPPDAVAPKLSGFASTQEDPLERDIEYLDKLLYKQQFDDALRSREEIAQAADRLKELLEEYKQTKDPELRKKILEEMKRLREQIKSALSRLNRLYDQMPDEFLNPEVREQLEKDDIGKLDQKLSRALESGDLDSAMEDMESFLDEVSSLMDGLQESSGEMNSEEFFKDLAKLQEAEAEAAKLEKEQKRILEKTQALQEKVEPAQDAEAMRKAVEEAKKHLDAAARQLSQARQDEEMRLRAREQAYVSPEARSDPAEQARRRADMQALQRFNLPQMVGGAAGQTDRAQESLERMDTENAQQAAQQALSQLQQARRQADESRKPAAGGRPQPGEPNSSSAMARAQGQLEKAIEKLRGAMGRDPPRLSEVDQNAMAELQKQQEGLRDRTDGLAQKLEELAGSSPMVDSNLGQQARGASSSMKQAGERLGQGLPSSAVPSEAQARAQLESLKNQLGEARDRMQKGAQGMGAPMPMGMGRMAGRGRQGVNGTMVNPHAPVEVPGAGQGQVPPELREEIIKSMKEPAPEEYEPLNDAYYKKLIR
ncbi:MAG: DUF4175 family protein [Bdellovibrionota bacterium]